MEEKIIIKNGIEIPAHEITFTASRSGGPGGQHVNKTSSRITLRWNVTTTHALSDEQKERVMTALASEITTEGDIIIHSSESRSQHQNKKNTIDVLIQKIKKALYVPKKRMATGVPKHAQKKRLDQKKRHSIIKKMRKLD